MDLPRLLIYLLATWRISSLLFREEGPWSLFERTRSIIGGGTFGQSLLSCFWCFSVWIGLGVAILSRLDFGWIILLPFAFSAGAIWIDGMARHE